MFCFCIYLRMNLTVSCAHVQTKQQMEQMQQMMSDPAAQAQLQQTMAAMQTPDMQRRMAALRVCWCCLPDMAAATQQKPVSSIVK